MKFDILTLFPGMFSSPLDESILKRAIDEGLIDVGLHNIRDFARDKHHTVDDTPYGGGSGMVMMAQPVVDAIETVKKEGSKVIFLSPAGRPFNQKIACELSTLHHIVLICGRYEGIDERISEQIDDVISIGDFVMTGGEIAALAIIDSVTRLLPGVLGCKDSTVEESFSWDLLEYPQYTKPRSFRGKDVPEVLLSGNHEAIRLWRRKEALRRTLEVRPDLIDKENLGSEDMQLINKIKQESDEGYKV
ncbi:MAG: tRNA (guanosine(37)-N1)-methyltransferase TrmD [bacterium]|nr:tRNA (guanosine(37)-N1)-methyltransferase TrmD [bacterium]